MPFSEPEAGAPRLISPPIAPLLLGFLALAAAIGAYSLWVGPIAFMGDSYLFADRAKHLFHLGNLDLNNHGSLVYPPLYSLFLAPCYALVDAARIITGITLLNSVLVASAIVPVHLLISHYSQVTGKERWFLTILVTASPVFVSYAPMVMSEALFIPLAYWTTYAIFRSLTDLSVRWFVTTGLLMAAALLSRSAATTLFVSGFCAWLLSLVFFSRISWNRKVVLLAVAGAAAVMPLLLWHWFEQRAVTYQGRIDYSIVNSLRALAASRPDQLIKLQWAANAVAYFLSAPLSLAAFLAVAVLACRPTTALRDPLIPFVAGSIALAIGSIVVLAPTSYGGGPLTWNKYFAPYVGLITIVALRLRPLVTRRTLAAALLLAGALSLTGRPSGLSCHFPDALTPYIDSALPLPLSPWLRDLLFFLLLAGTAPWLASDRPRPAWLVGAGLAAGLCLFSTGATARFWRHAGVLNLTNYDGLAVRLLEAAKRDPGTPLYYDPSIGERDTGEALRTLFYYPKLIPALPQSTLFSPDQPLPARFYYVTRGQLPSAELIATAGENLHLYRISGSVVRKGFAFQTAFGPDVGGQEAIPFGGKPALVRWLGPKPEFRFQLDHAMPEATVGLRLAAAGRPRRVKATLNGVRLPAEPEVQHVLWNGGFDYVQWNAPLRAGTNVLQLENDSEPILLPDGGRQVTFLLIDEPLLSRPEPSNP